MQENRCETVLYREHKLWEQKCDYRQNQDNDDDYIWNRNRPRNKQEWAVKRLIEELKE